MGKAGAGANIGAMSKLPIVTDAAARGATDWLAEALLAIDGSVEQLARAQAALVHDAGLGSELVEAEALLGRLAALRAALRDRALARFGG